MSRGEKSWYRHDRSNSGLAIHIYSFPRSERVVLLLAFSFRMCASAWTMARKPSFRPSTVHAESDPASGGRLRPSRIVHCMTEEDARVISWGWAVAIVNQGPGLVNAVVAAILTQRAISLQRMSPDVGRQALENTRSTAPRRTKATTLGSSWQLIRAFSMLI